MYIFNRDRAYAEFKNKSDSSNNRGNWSHLKIIHKISEQHGKPIKELQKTAILGTAHILRQVKVQNVCQGT